MAAETAAKTMPVGNTLSTPLRASEVKTTKGDEKAPLYEDDAAATIVWENYNTARTYVENNAWLLEWQETDILLQSPIPNRFIKVEQGRPARIPRFLVAKFTRTMARAVKRGIFAEQYPFLLRATGKTKQEQIDAWTALIGKLLKRMKFEYHGGLLIECQTLQGTGIGKYGWEEKKRIIRKRVRKNAATTVDLPSGDSKEVPTAEGDEFEIKEETKLESWPFFEFRRLGTTLFDPKWCTPDMPDESAGYCIDVDYVNFSDLQQMRELSCYQNIPADDVLKQYFFSRQEGTAPSQSNVAEQQASQGSMVAHAEGENQSTDVDPLKQTLMIIEQWDTRTVKTILCYDGRYLLIRNEEHFLNRSGHCTATWWPIPNNGYGMGIGRIAGPDQRINQGIINECLKMIAYPMNAPVLYARGENAPTQNIMARLGGMFAVDVPPGGDVNKAMRFMDMPTIPADAWKMLQLSQQNSEELTGANSQMQQGNTGGPGSSAVRTAAGVNRIAGMSDQSVADPVESFARGVIVPVIEFLVEMVRLKMPMAEIREILSEKHAAVIEKAIDQDDFVSATFEIDVLAGQKLMAKAGIQQLIPFFLQIVQQPQLLEFLHQKGDTVDFGVMMDLMLQVSELTQQPDIFRKLTPEEKQALQDSNPDANKLKQAAAIEQLKGSNKVNEIHEKGNVDLATKAAETVMQHTADGISLARANGLVERSNDVDALKNGLPDFTS